MEQTYAVYAFVYLIALTLLTTYVARRLYLLPERIGTLPGIILAVALTGVVSAIVGLSFIYYSSRISEQKAQLRTKEDANRQLQEELERCRVGSGCDPLPAGDEPFPCPEIPSEKAAYKKAVFQSATERSCEDQKENPSKRWYLITAWNRYYTNEAAKEGEKNIFNLGVRKFVDRVQQSSRNLLSIQICTLNEFIDKNKETLEGLLPKDKNGEADYHKLATTVILPLLQKANHITMVHASPSYWGEAIPGSEIINNTVPFGMTTQGMDAWLASEEGQSRMQKMYADHHLVALPMGDTGVQMGGWYKEKVEDSCQLGWNKNAYFRPR